MAKAHKELANAIILAAIKTDMVLFEYPQFAGRTETGGWARGGPVAGHPDIAGWRRVYFQNNLVAQAVYIEVKTDGQLLSGRQRDFLLGVRKSGALGLAIWPDQFEEAIVLFGQCKNMPAPVMPAGEKKRFVKDDWLDQLRASLDQ